MTIEASGGTIHWLMAPGGIRLRAAHWPDGARGTVLLLNGRTDFIERYHEPIAELQARGFAVWMLDWRGQGASQRIAPDPTQNHVDRFTDYLADVEHLLDTLVLPRLGGRPLVLMAHSMGGHLGAHLLSRRPELFSRAVLCAPMVDFVRGVRIHRRVAAILAQLACLRPGMVYRFGPGTAPEIDTDRPFDGNPLTSCPNRYAARSALMRAHPKLLVGGASWGWLRACLASTIALNRTSTIRRIQMPVLIAIAGADRLVDNAAIRQFARRLPCGQVLEFPGARHELLNEVDTHRLALWAAIDQFLEAI